MKPRNSKAKGRRLQTLVRERLLSSFPVLHPDDIKCAIMGESGTDIKLSPAARHHIPFSFECKNTEKLNVWDALQQAESNATIESPAVLVFKRNQSEPYVAVHLETFLTMLKDRDRQ